MKSLNTYINENFKISKTTEIPKPEKPDYVWQLHNLVKEYAKRSPSKDYLDLTNIDISNIDRFGYYEYDDSYHNVFENFMFKTIDISTWKTTQVRDMSGMFSCCEELLEIKNIEDFDVSNVREMYSMFEDCKKIQHLDLSKWKLRDDVSFSRMFCNCQNLIDLKLPDDFEQKLKSSISKKETKYNLIFYNCHKSIVPDWFLRKYSRYNLQLID